MKDVFLCHATEDKKEIVRPLCEHLSVAGISCWHDEAEIQWGDSITERINKGLLVSRYVVVVLSPAFLSKKWPQREMNAALSAEASTGDVKVLPLIVGTAEKREEILTRYPLIRDKLYLSWDAGLEAITDALRDRIGVLEGEEATEDADEDVDKQDEEEDEGDDLAEMSSARKKTSVTLCSATTKQSTPCKNHAMKGAAFCYVHSLGRIQRVPIWKNATFHFAVGLFAAVVIAIVSSQYTASRKTQAQAFWQVEYNTSLLDDIWLSQHESKLLEKYPSGYVLFGVDPCSVDQIHSEKRLIPRKGRVLEEYEFKWDRVTISELTNDSVTIELPNITYKPMNTRIYGCGLSFKRNSPGKPRILPVRPAGAKNRIFAELAYDKPSLLAFVIGFKRE